MDRDKITWCAKQNKGIVLIQLKPHLLASYFREADETLENVHVSIGKWKIITAYYACYHALYAILMKCGIKSEIHDCTLSLMDLYDFSEAEKDFMQDLKEKRINVQYYLKNITLEDAKPVAEFILRCKVIAESLTSIDLQEKREELEAIIKK